MTKLTISRKPEGIYGTSKKTPQASQQDKTTLAHKQCVDRKTPQQVTAKRKSEKCRKKNIRRIKRLVALWPELFSLESPKPLKVGIFDDLIQDIAGRGISLGQGILRATLARYAQTPRYYRALMAGGARYDLKGQPCGEVTHLEQQKAVTRLMALNEKRKRQTAREKTGA
jgi:Activator of osmoprotectant transporter ProP